LAITDPVVVSVKFAVVKLPVAAVTVTASIKLPVMYAPET
jgi:hypothetical protein